MGNQVHMVDNKEFLAMSQVPFGDFKSAPNVNKSTIGQELSINLYPSKIKLKWNSSLVLVDHKYRLSINTQATKLKLPGWKKWFHDGTALTDVQFSNQNRYSVIFSSR